MRKILKVKADKIVNGAIHFVIARLAIIQRVLTPTPIDGSNT